MSLSVDVVPGTSVKTTGWYQVRGPIRLYWTDFTVGSSDRSSGGSRSRGTPATRRYKRRPNRLRDKNQESHKGVGLGREGCLC